MHLSTGASDLLVADSFRVRRRTGPAEARGFSLHLRRFRRSALAAAAEHGTLDGTDFPSELDAYLQSATNRIAAGGDGFPRLELWRNSGARLKLTLALRPRPPLNTQLDMRSVPAVATLTHPERKGPGIASYWSLARTIDAEPLLIDLHGHAVEGGTTSLLWWKGSEARVSASTARVDSVTERLVHDTLDATGIRVAEAHATPAELMVAEVWALNALHGIRTVSAIDGRILPPPNFARLATARERLERQWVPIEGATPLLD